MTEALLSWHSAGQPRPRLLVVAQCPKPGPPSARALQGSRSLRRVAAWAGLDDPDELYERATVVNLLDRHPGTVWPVGEARERALQLTVEHADHDRVVLLGAAVRAAFPVAPDLVDWFRWRRRDGVWWAATPHPSGLSRSYNDPAVEQGARTFWRAVLG